MNLTKIIETTKKQWGLQPQDQGKRPENKAQDQRQTDAQVRAMPPLFIS